jgi:hypothetical protein
MAQQSIADSTQYAGEKHFKNIQQLTFGGDNAEAYFSFDGKYIIFQKQILKKELIAIKCILEKYLKRTKIYL